jgi:hypothetical protein
VAFGLLKLASHSIACCALSAAFMRLFNQNWIPADPVRPAAAEGVQV